MSQESSSEPVYLKLSSPSIADVEEYKKTHICQSKTPKEHFFCNADTYLRALFQNQQEYQTILKAIEEKQLSHIDQTQLNEQINELHFRFAHFSREFEKLKGPKKENVDLDEFVEIFWAYLHDFYHYENMKDARSEDLAVDVKSKYDDDISACLKKLEAHKKRVSEFVDKFEYL